MSLPALTAAVPLAGSTFLSLAGQTNVSAEKVARVARDFEATLLTELLKGMRQTLEPDTMFGKDQGDVFGGLFDFFMSKHLADSGGIGVADTIERQLQAKRP